MSTLSTCKSHESYGRIMPPAPELWYTRDIVLDLIVTSQKYPLIQGTKTYPFLSLWRASIDFYHYHLAHTIVIYGDPHNLLSHSISKFEKSKNNPSTPGPT